MAIGKSTPRGIVQRAKDTLTRFLPKRGNGSVAEPSGDEADVAAPADATPADPESPSATSPQPAAVEPPKPSPSLAAAEETAAPPEEDRAADRSEPVAAVEAAEEAVDVAEEAVAELAAATVTVTSTEDEATKLVARRMGDPEYRQEQYANRYEGRVAPINRLIDELVEESGEWMPYVAPVYGGTEARLLTLFRDPGPKTKVDKGSGMLSLENDDQSAERFLTFFEEAGMQVDDLMTWNTYPWYINRKPSAAEIDRGLEPLERIIALLPELTVVMAHGGDAHTAWRRFERKNPAVAEKFLVIPTYHTSKQALFTPDPEVRAAREAKLRDDFARAAAHLASRK
ncbi:uracil-DNA glycosylase [Nocardia shimofusensis]|uniref:uracil-DNA glycosylase n=1 Tax=Nocardia shimofusensis TaxID=228596 RepID=UPI000AEE8ACB|nr:uracil-DNA glycosylase [Nocardia shimofusensis]